jgi:hypothetical protein
MTEALLAATLEVAVPMWIEQMRSWPPERVQARAKELAPVIASTADNVLFRGKKRGQTAEAFNRLAEGVACLAFAPGGVKIFGLHFEANPSNDGEGGI